AQRYSKILNDIEKVWQETLREAKTPPKGLPNAAEEELRQVFHGLEAPPNVPLPPLGDLALLPDRPSQAKLQELLKALETWRATGPGAPPRAMVLEDLPVPYEPHVFLRGSPGNL